MGSRAAKSAMQKSRKVEKMLNSDRCSGEQKAWEAGEAGEERSNFHVCEECGEKVSFSYVTNGYCEGCHAVVLGES